MGRTLDLAKLTQQGSGSNAIADGFSKAVEFVLTPLFAAAIGYFLDRWLGTSPILTVIFAVWALAVTVGMTIRDYNARMRVEEDRLLGRRTETKA